MGCPFKYQPIAKKGRQIRLIKITSRAGQEIACSITHVDLDAESPVYQAVSYTWGPKRPRYNIKVNGRNFRVRKNLYNFLRAHTKASSESGCLWIDQLCINQKDKDEKSQQVQMMAHIYQSASMVISWLGPSNDHTPIAVWFLELLQDDHMLLQQALPLYHGQFLSGSMLKIYKDLIAGAQQRRHNLHSPSTGAITLQGDTRDAVWDFLNNRYWTRLWIVQEVMLARSWVVWWGKYRVSRDALEGLCHKVDITYKDSVQSPWLRLNVIINHGLCRDYELGYNKPEKVDDELANLVRMFGSNGCEDKRDKVYALMALVRQEFAVKIDYSQSIAVVYLSAVRTMGDSIICASERSGGASEPTDWDVESFIIACHRLGIEMVPETFQSILQHPPSDDTYAAKLLQPDEYRLFKSLSKQESVAYMVQRLESLLADTKHPVSAWRRLCLECKCF